MGQSNVWYADTPEAKPLLRKIGQLLADKKPVNKKSPRSPRTDAERNKKVEEAAIGETKQYYEIHGYKLTSVEKENRGWDLEAARDNEKLRIEVKGLSGSDLSVELTPNEYAALKKKDKDYRLCVVSQALKNPCLHVCRYSKERAKWIVEESRAVVKIERKIHASIKLYSGE